VLRVGPSHPRVGQTPYARGRYIGLRTPATMPSTPRRAVQSKGRPKAAPADS